MNVTRRKSIVIDRADFIATDLGKYTSYENEIKSSVELNNSSNFHTNFKLGISCTAKL